MSNLIPAEEEMMPLYESDFTELLAAYNAAVDASRRYAQVVDRLEKAVEERNGKGRVILCREDDELGGVDALTGEIFVMVVPETVVHIPEDVSLTYEELANRPDLRYSLLIRNKRERIENDAKHDPS